MTMAMQRASPIRIRPYMYSGLSRRKTTARPNISSGPMIQFWTRERVRILTFLKTSPSSSYFTLARAGTSSG